MANRRTPAQIAADDLAATTERREKAEKRLENAREELAKAEKALITLKALEEYQKGHPLLQEEQQTEVPEPEQDEEQATEAAPVAVRKTTRRTKKG